LKLAGPGRGWLVVISLLLGVACWFAPRLAAAQTALPSDTRIVVSGCSMRINERSLHDQIRVELLAAGVQRVRTVELYADDISLEEEPEEVATLRITFSDCDESGREIKLGIAARRTGKHVERTLAVSDVPDSMHARAIALAMTELLRSSWQDLSAQQQQQATADVQSRQLPTLNADVIVRSAERSAVDRALRQRLRLEWQGGGRMYPQTDSGEASSAFALSKVFGERTRVQLAASAAGGGGQGSDARMFQGVARTTVALCSQRDHPGIEVGGVIELGWAHLRGTMAGEHSGFIATGLVQGTLRMQAAQEIEALIVLQAGYVIAPVTLRSPPVTNGVRGAQVGFQGPVIGLAVGIAGLL
jgi:hypothetical protein